MRQDYQLVTVRGLFDSKESYADKTVTIALADGSCFQNLQLVYSSDLENFAQIAKMNVGAAIIATGKIVLTPNAKQPLEMQVEKIELEGASTSDYPLQKKRHSFEYLRTIPHLRPRTNTFAATYRVTPPSSRAVTQKAQARCSR